MVNHHASQALVLDEPKRIRYIIKPNITTGSSTNIPMQGIFPGDIFNSSAKRVIGYHINARYFKRMITNRPESNKKQVQANGKEKYIEMHPGPGFSLPYKFQFLRFLLEEFQGFRKVHFRQSFMR
jgi:hypothetical protein